MNFPGGLRSAWLRRGAPLVAGLAATLLLIVHVFRLWDAYPAGLDADAYCYANFARSLAHGHLNIHNEITPLLAEWKADPVQAPWNTVVLEDGRWVYNLAPGFPLVLALVYKLFGLFLTLNLNLGFLVAAFILLAALVGTIPSEDRGSALSLGALALLGAMGLDPATQLRFVNLWREPLMILLLLASAWMLDQEQRNRRWFWSIPLLLGLSCTVKESNFLYALGLGGVLLFDSGFRGHVDWKRRVLFGSLLFVAACLPLLLQNINTTGSVFGNAYVQRETANFSVSEPGLGLSTGNARYTLLWYLRLYQPYGVWLIPLLAAAIWGMFLSRRERLGRLMTVWLLLHLALYLQWGRADFRHMYFCIFPVLWLALRALYGLSLRLDRHLPRSVFLSICALLAVALSAFHEPTVLRSSVDFGYADWRHLTREMEKQVPENGVILVNRTLRDIVGGYSDRTVLGLQELLGLSGRSTQETLQDLLDQGSPVFFLDNPDRAPRSVHGKIDLTQLDLKRILHDFDLESRMRISSDARSFRTKAGTLSLTLSQLVPRDSRAVSLQFGEPGEGAAFLYAPYWHAETRMKIFVNGQFLPHDFTQGPWVPLAGLPGPWSVALQALTSRGLPSMDGAAAVSWDEPIVMGTGVDAIPDDQSLFPDLPADQPFQNRRVFAGRISLRVPVREGGGFTLLGLGVSQAPDDRWEAHLLQADREPLAFPVQNRQGWVALPPDPGQEVPWSGYRDVQIEMPGTVQVTRVVSHFVPDGPFPVLLTAEHDERFPVLSGMYTMERDEEAFRWARSRSSILLPVPEGAGSMQLRIRLSAPIPDRGRTPVRLVWGDAVLDAELGQEAEWLEWIVPVVGSDRPAHLLTMEAPAWVPSSRGNADSRELALRWYALEWSVTASE